MRLAFDHDGDDRSARRADLPTVVANLRPAIGRDVKVLGATV
jgi:hypothetical protein